MKEYQKKLDKICEKISLAPTHKNLEALADLVEVEKKVILNLEKMTPSLRNILNYKITLIRSYLEDVMRYSTLQYLIEQEKI